MITEDALIEFITAGTRLLLKHFGCEGRHLL